MAAERDAFPIPTGHPPRKRGIKLCQHTSSKRRQRFPVCKQSGYGIAAISATPRRARRPLRALRVARPVESARSDVSRASSRVSNPPDPRARPLRRVAHPGYHSWHPVGQQPPSSHRCPRLSRARRRTPETTTTSLSRRGAHDGWHTPPPPPPPIRVRVPPTRTSPDRCARPLYSVVWQEKNIPSPFSRESDREERLGPKLPRIPGLAASWQRSPRYSALLQKCRARRRCPPLPPTRRS